MSTATAFSAVHEPAASRFQGQHVPTGPGDGPALHLYHAANSICSQKVRTVLDHTATPYLSHAIDIFEGENYQPSYVRMRMAGCLQAGLPMADKHLGTTSVASGGCDACVVPTLVDTAAEKVLVDSRRICVALDRGKALVPPALREQIERELAVIDELPNYQILAMGVGKPSADGTPNGFALAKVARCDALLAEHAADETLSVAYTAKRSKEKMAAERLFDTDSLRNAYAGMADAVRRLESRLPRNGGYLFGDQVTMADLFWGIELVRFEDLGMAVLWDEGRLPAVAAYFRKLCSLPSIRRAVIDWPGARLPRRPTVNLQQLGL